MIHENDSLIGATVGTYKRPLRVWDDGGFGDAQLYVYLEAGYFGPVGVVRAQTWEDAYSCVEDEIMDDADDDTIAEIVAEHGEDGAWDVMGDYGIRCRSNGVPAAEELHSVYAQEDLNGSFLELLTPELAERYGISLEIAE